MTDGEERIVKTRGLKKKKHKDFRDCWSVEENIDRAVTKKKNKEKRTSEPHFTFFSMTQTPTFIFPPPPTPTTLAPSSISILLSRREQDEEDADRPTSKTMMITRQSNAIATIYNSCEEGKKINRLWKENILRISNGALMKHEDIEGTISRHWPWR